MHWGTHPSWRIFWIWAKYKTNDLYPAFLWYFRYPKQERTKFFRQDFFCNRDFKIPHFSLMFYYIAILYFSHFWEIFTILNVISGWIYLESSNFLTFSLTSVGISWWRNFLNQLHGLPARCRQSVVGRAKNEMHLLPDGIFWWFLHFWILMYDIHNSIREGYCREMPICPLLTL